MDDHAMDGVDPDDHTLAVMQEGDKVAPKAAIRRDRPAGSAMVVAPAT
jgi:hypothetical protein